MHSRIMLSIIHVFHHTNQSIRDHAHKLNAAPRIILSMFLVFFTTPILSFVSIPSFVGWYWGKNIFLRPKHIIRKQGLRPIFDKTNHTKFIKKCFFQQPAVLKLFRARHGAEFLSLSEASTDEISGCRIFWDE